MTAVPAAHSIFPEPARFVVWGPPAYGSRSRWFADQLGIPVDHVYTTQRRGGWIAPYKYLRQAWSTVLLLRRHRPETIFFQSPPTFGPMIAAVWPAPTVPRIVIDAHSDAMMTPIWNRPAWVYRWLTRRVDATIVTNQAHADIVERRGGVAVVVPGIPAVFDTDDSYPLAADQFHVAVVSTYASDEPYREVIAAAQRVSGVHLHLTGKPPEDPLFEQLPPHVHTTGFLPDAAYYGLLERVDAVMCLTTRDDTMQNGAVEAMSIGTPIITSDWPVLRSYFRTGTVHVDNSVEGIAQGIARMRTDHPRYREEMSALRQHQHEVWERGLAQLRSVLGV